MARNFEPNKRQRTDDGAPDRFKAAPSCCVHVRSLSEHAIEGDLVEAVQQFGPVRDVIMMPRKRQALIEFEDMKGARNCVEFCQNGHPVYCAGRPAFFNYSTSQSINRPGDGDDTRPPNHILLFTILNPQYPITVEVIHTITSTYGEVERIVIFKKNGVQSLVEFDSVDSAKRARQGLNGADIYSGCCTLKIEFAKAERLNIVENNSESWDFTNPSLGGKDGPGGRGQPLLQGPRYGSPRAPYNGPAGFGGPGVGGGGAPSGGFGGPRGGYYDEGFDGGPYGPPHDRYSPRGGTDRYGRMSYDDGSALHGAVCMVYGLNMEKMNCDGLFNLFCCYGNVHKIKYLKSKEGSAMIQMGDPISVERAIANLNQAFFFGNKLHLSMSKQAYLQEVHNPHELPDGTVSYKDYTTSRNNRFTSPEAAQKNRSQSPAKVLHFFNAPPAMSDQEISELFENAIDKKPTRVKKFIAKSERSCTGVIEFESKADAVEGLITVNHTPISVAGGKNPFIFKLCFSSMSTVMN